MTVRGTGSSERLVKAHSALRSMQRLSWAESFVVDDRIPAIWCAIIFSSDLRAQRRPSRASSCCWRPSLYERDGTGAPGRSDAVRHREPERQDPGGVGALAEPWTPA